MFAGKMVQYKLLIHSAKQVVQVVSNGEAVLYGENVKDQLVVLESQKEGLSIIVDKWVWILSLFYSLHSLWHDAYESLSYGNISSIASDSSVPNDYKDATFDKIIDATGCCILPGELKLFKNRIMKQLFWCTEH